MCTDAICDPIAYGWVGVSAVDDRDWPDPYFADHCTDNLVGLRAGNEGAIAPPVKIFRVHRTPPDPPELPEYDDDVWATKANYAAESFWSFRWKNADLPVHVYRALDHSLYMHDYKSRQDGVHDPLLTSDPVFSTLDPNGNWNHQDIVSAIDNLHSIVMASSTLDDAINNGYASLTATQVRILASMGHTQEAFTQLTINPVSEADSQRPDDDDGYVADSTLRAHTDTLDGKARNRYFYRVAAIDAANNIGEMSVASPRVNLPVVTPPKIPRITKVVPGDREITIHWVAADSPSLVGYKILRADNEEDTRDIRLMTEVADLPLVSLTETNGSFSYTDGVGNQLVGNQTMYYTMVAYDGEATPNVSIPSKKITTMAFDASRPDHPTWDTPVTTPDGVTLSWTSPDANLTCMVQRSLTGQNSWITIQSWMPKGTYTFDDENREPGETYDYRLKVMDDNGRLNDPTIITGVLQNI
jgi:hypothetical protein